MSNVPKNLWNQTVTIKNSYALEFYVADDSWLSERYLHTFYQAINHRRFVFTRRNKKNVPDAGDWVLETDDNGISFTFKNKMYGEYLYAAGTDNYTKPTKVNYTHVLSNSISGGGPSFSSSHGSNISDSWKDRDRYVFTWHNKIKDNQCYWYIIPLPNKENEFWIKNTFYNEYLYIADEYDWDKRNVYTSCSGSEMEKYREAHWVIELA